MMARIPDIDWIDDYRGESWMLGNDIDCDTCGTSWNEAEFDPDFQGPNKWSFNYNVGCYGGAGLDYDSENREQKLDEMFEYLSTFPGWSGIQEMAVRTMIAECDSERS